MKRIICLLVLILSLASCAQKMTERTEVFYPDGQPKVVKRFDKSGNCVFESTYYESGQVKMEGPMKNGEREGEWKAYFPDGKTQSTGFFEAGKRTGVAKVYWYNGNPREEGFYKNGKHCGKWRYYDEQGNFFREDDYGD